MRLFRRQTRFRPSAGVPLLLHVGSGRERLDGWVNIDLQDLPGVDVVADVTKGLDFTGAAAVFAEHFLEHLAIDDAFAFLAEAHRALAPGGWLRLSTPNLEWVWATHYHREASAAEREVMALRANRAFHAWGHRFLWNWPLLEEALAAGGFAPVRSCRYGESELPVFRGIERHATYGDDPDLPHVLIAEACRTGSPDRARLRKLRDLVETEFLEHWRAR
jgi:hypothetical protein